MRTITHILPLISSSLLVAGDSEEIKIDGLKTSPDLDHALSLAKSKKKPILVVFQQEDCEWCELLVDKVLSNPEVQKELNKRFIVTFVDMNENYKLADEYKILGTPTEWKSTPETLLFIITALPFWYTGNITASSITIFLHSLKHPILHLHLMQVQM